MVIVVKKKSIVYDMLDLNFFIIVKKKKILVVEDEI